MISAQAYQVEGIKMLFFLNRGAFLEASTKTVKPEVDCFQVGIIVSIAAGLKMPGG